MASELPPVCLLAGGLGSRLGDRVADTPKPLLEVAGEPFLNHQLRLLAANGARRVVLCVGYLGHLIEERIGSSPFGLEVAYRYDSPGLDGTLGAIRGAADALGERFLVLYGDTFLPIDYRAAAEAWARAATPALMVVLRNEGRWDTSNAVLDGARVIAYDKHAPTARMKWIDYGLGGLTADCLERVGPGESDLAALYSVLARTEELAGFEVTQRFYEIGTPESFAETAAYLRERSAS